jgi:hypothetical protein
VVAVVVLALAWAVSRAAAAAVRVSGQPVARLVAAVASAA